MYHLINKTLGFLAAASLFMQAGMITAFAKPDWPSDTGIMAEAGIVIDMESGAVLFGQQIHVAYAPASITKLLTALVVAENNQMDDEVEFSQDAVYNVESGSGNKLNLDTGDKLSVEDSLYVMLLLSSNQAANALAEHTAGSREAFVDMMNQKLEELGCTESHFANPSGLNDNSQYVSAYDMAMIAKAAFANEKVLEISSARKHSIPATINNPNGASFNMEHRLLVTEDTDSQYFCEGAVAGKTGYTSVAGNTLVTYACRDGRKQIAVVLKGTQPQYYLDSQTILDFGFASFKNVKIGEQETFLKDQENVDINGTSHPVSELSLDPEAVVTLPVGAEFSDAERSLVTELPEDHPAGAVALLQYTYNDRKIGSSYLYGPVPETVAAGEDGGAVPVEPVNAAGESLQGDGPIGDGSQEAVSPAGERKTGSILVPVAVVLLAAGALTGLVLYIRERRRKELEESRKRRERRRQRILESGCSEEEFERLMTARTRSRDHAQAKAQLGRQERTTHRG